MNPNPPPLTRHALFTYYQIDGGQWLWKRVNLSSDLFIDITGPDATLRVKESAPVEIDIPQEEGVLYNEKQDDGSYKVRVAKIANAAPITTDGVLSLLPLAGMAHVAELVDGSADTYKLNVGMLLREDILVFADGSLLLPGIDYDVQMHDDAPATFRVLRSVQAPVFVHYR